MLTAEPRLRDARHRAQRGLSLVEMMVGIAVGLIVVAGASLLVSSQLGENRRLLVETQLQQDMRASMDIIARELRRMGAQREALALDGLASAGGAKENLRATVGSPTVTGVAPVQLIQFEYQPSYGDKVQFGFELTNGGVVRSKIGDGINAQWHELTDANVLNVTALNITPTHSALLRLPCPKLCPGPGGPTACWPQVMVRDLEVEMTAEARSDSNVVRTLTSHVRVRNDVVKFNISSTEICPV